MNKKLIVLIVALECVFSIFLISIFGPMIEAIHSKVIVKDLYFVDEAGERMLNAETITVNLDESRSFHFDFEVVTEEATDRTVEIIHNRTDEEILLEEDVDGFGFTVHFLSKNISSVTIIVRANDSSQKSASITLSKSGSNINIGDDF
ncbi:MAG: hypothetical protein J6V07_02255 [Clostridia bacterium]|nr:hypothetical protein [Clostridia bacterium]